MVKFVAEVSSNHHRDLNRCLAFVDQAAEMGCSGVKFQLFKIRDLFAPEILAKSEMHRQRESWELPIHFLPHLAERCHSVEIQFICTPFYLKAVEELYTYVDLYKIASYELLWKDLLITCAQTGKPVILSTGMATLDEVKKAVDTLQESGCKDLTLLHCVSGYPAPGPDCNLSAIETLRSAFHLFPSPFGLKIGWSDHSVNPAVIYRAVHRWGASMVEFHLDLEGQGEEFRTGHCWLPEQIKPVIEAVQGGLEADGEGQKRPMPSEMAEREWRADPGDGLRPLVEMREGVLKEGPSVKNGST